MSLNLLPIFLLGLLGSVHCIGMCGGIVGAFSASPAKPFPVAVVAADSRMLALDSGLRLLAYNAGRIGSYMIAGALAGGLAGGVQVMANVASLQIAGYWLANLMLVALGLYLMDVWRGLARVEALGQILWRHLQGLLKYLLPVDSPAKALALGGLWGWVPCGMVYSVLVTAMLSGTAVSGAAVMLVFGLGTLPMLLTMGMLGTRFQQSMQRRSVRIAGGLVILLFGMAGLLRAASGMDPGWFGIFCIAPTGVHS